jgi:hypothetical protein
MIGALENAIDAARDRGLVTEHAREYLDANEWLLALEELEALKDAAYQAQFADTFRDIRKAMGDPPDPRA